jgi:hypothetical protein
VLLWVESKAVDIDSISWGSGVVGISLDIVEVVSVKGIKAIVSVELEVGEGYWVSSSVKGKSVVELGYVAIELSTASVVSSVAVNRERNIGYSEGMGYTVNFKRWNGSIKSDLDFADLGVKFSSEWSRY